MKNTVFKMFIIVIIALLLVVFVFPWKNFGINVPFTSGDYRLGLDLQGGIELDYKIDLDEYRASEDYTKEGEGQVIEGLKSIIDKRVQVLNINDSEINDASYGNEKHIIVQIPLKANDSLDNKENIEKAKAAIGRVVKIAFKERRTEITEEDLAQRKQIADDALSEIESGEDFSVVADKIKLNYDLVSTGQASNYTEIASSSEGIDVDKINEITNIKTGLEEFLIVSEKEKEVFDYILISKNPSEWKDAADSQGRVLDDTYFVNSSVQFNQAYQPMVELTFNEEGAKIFGELTKRLTGQQMAIFVGGELLTAPNINEPIYGGKAVITGDYTTEEANELSKNINTGVVPAPIYLTSEKTIDSKIGASSLDKLIFAGGTGFILIFIFLIFIYRTAGVMAGFALAIYLILILFVVKVSGTVLTLASIAGLVLSFGMAIDANILIFERIKNELHKGASLHSAIDSGFKESWSAIWDSNITGLIVAMILYIFGINLIKGFGLMLAIGIIFSFFTAMVISRVFINFIAQFCSDNKKFIGMNK